MIESSGSRPDPSIESKQDSSNESLSLSSAEGSQSPEKSFWNSMSKGAHDEIIERVTQAVLGHCDVSSGATVTRSELRRLMDHPMMKFCQWMESKHAELRPEA